MEKSEFSVEGRDLSSYLKTKRKHFWVRRFILVKAGILYYYKNATATVPRGIIHLEGAEINKDPKELVLDISKANITSVKLQFPNISELNLWYQYLSLSVKGSEKLASQDCSYLELQKKSERENNQLIEQIPKTSMQNALLPKIKEIIEREYKVLGTRGSSTFACSNHNANDSPNNQKWNNLYIIAQIIVLEAIRYMFGEIIALVIGLCYLGYVYSLSNFPDEQIIDSKIYFRCSVLIKSCIGEILTALHDTYSRQAWEPYLIDCNESTTIKLTYIFNDKSLRQEIHRFFIKEPSHFYLVEKIGPEIKNLFKIETRNKRGEFQCLVNHYGSLSFNDNPLVGNADILSCLKTYVESTTVYVSSNEIINDYESDNEELNHSMSIAGTEIDDSNPWNSEALRVLKEAEAILEEQDGWEDLKLKSQFIKGSRRKAAGGLFVIRGEGIINRSVPEIIGGLTDLSIKARYDSMYESGYIVETINESMEIVYQKYKSKGPVSARDFCLLQKRFDYPGGKVVAVATSITHKECPETKFVRAHLFMGCHFLTPTGPNTTLDVYMVYADIKGSVPKFIINSVQNDQAMLVDNLRNYLN